MKIKIDIEGKSKEIAELIQTVQVRRSNGDVKKLTHNVFKKFCDVYDLHDDEIDKMLNTLIRE